MGDINPDPPMEITFMDLRLQNSGSSLRVTIPSKVVEDTDVEKGDMVYGRYDREAGTLTYYLK